MRVRVRVRVGGRVRVCLARVVEPVVALIGAAAAQLAVLEEPRAGAAAPQYGTCLLQRVVVPDQLGAHLVRVRVRVRVRVGVWVGVRVSV